MPSDSNGISCFQQNFEKNLELPLKFQFFTFLWVLAPSWQNFGCQFVSAKPGWTILLIDRSEPRFEIRTGGKIMKTLNKDGKLDNFC